VEVVLIVALVVGLAIAAAVLGHALERKRRAELEAWARERGWSFSAEKRGAPGHAYDLFRRGHSRFSRYHAQRCLDDATPGLDGGGATLFEYHYAVTHHTGKTSHTTHYYSTCALVDPGADLGRVLVRGEGLGDKLAQAIGFDDIDFEDGEFSRRFVVQASDRKQAYDLLDGAMMRFLVAHGGWRVETRGRELLVHRNGRVSPGAFDEIAAFTRGFLAQLPRPLVNAERGRRGLPPVIEAGNAAPSSRARRPD
jgi:hypothetical protein